MPAGVLRTGARTRNTIALPMTTASRPTAVVALTAPPVGGRLVIVASVVVAAAAGGGGGGGGRRRGRRARGVRGRDHVGVEGHLAVAGEQSPCTVAPVVAATGGQRQDGTHEHRVRPKRGRAADPPEHVAGVAAVDEVDGAGRCGDETRSPPEHEHRVRVTLGVECQRPGEAEGAPGVHAGHERLSAEIGGHRGRRGTASGVVVGRGHVGLGLKRDPSAAWITPLPDGAGREADDRRAGAHPEIAADGGRPGVGDCGAGENGEAAGRAETDRCLLGGCRLCADGDRMPPQVRSRVDRWRELCE